MYEDYMQNLMGFSNTYDEMNFNPYYNYYEPSFTRQGIRGNMNVDEMENCYPEIYKIVYPMVKKRCMANTMPVTKNLIDNMVDDITSHIEENNGIELNINLNNEVCQNRDENQADSKDEQDRSCTQETRQRRNSLIADIVRILILRELTGRPGFRPGPGPRPPFPPPFPGNRPGPRPPFPGARPPMPRYDDIQDVGEYWQGHWGTVL